MCELFGLSSDRKVRVNEILKTFFEDGNIHSHGWGIASWHADNKVSLIKEPENALRSALLKDIMSEDMSYNGVIAHMRRATIGDIEYNNTHPFMGEDSLGRTVVMVHNGTIFDSPELNEYQYIQKGTTDSERIFLYILDRFGDHKSHEERFEFLNDTVIRLSENNKLNLLLFDGEYMYVHKNEAQTLYVKETEGCAIFSTRPLNETGWEEIPLDRLLVYRNGQKVYEGTTHDHTYVFNEEQMQMLYMSYSGL
ncbi:MAG: class II glutamine amidotransferase [Clostridiales bacterium]|nr:class II glutamine amidotransferase [Clostridiales bacterium]